MTGAPSIDNPFNSCDDAQHGSRPAMLPSQGTYVKAEMDSGVDHDALVQLKNLTLPPDLLPPACGPRIPGYLYLPQPIVQLMNKATSGSGLAYKFHNFGLPLASMIPQMADTCNRDTQCVAFDDQVQFSHTAHSSVFPYIIQQFPLQFSYLKVFQTYAEASWMLPKSRKIQSRQCKTSGISGIFGGPPTNICAIPMLQI